MNVAERGNTATHEVLHLFGLADRYNYWQRATGQRVDPATPFESIPTALPGTYDIQYFGNEWNNMMSTLGNQITQQQWGTVFNSRVESIEQTTFFGNSRNTYLNPVNPRKRPPTPLTVIDGKVVYYRLNANTGNYDIVPNNAQIGAYFNADTGVGNDFGNILWNIPRNQPVMQQPY